jgi:hypothetical protein
VRILALFDPTVRPILPLLDTPRHATCAKAERLLGLRRKLTEVTAEDRARLKQLEREVFELRRGATAEVRGAAAVAETLKGRARAAQPALVNCVLGLVWMSGGQRRVVFGFTIAQGKAVAIDLMAIPSTSVNSI